MNNYLLAFIILSLAFGQLTRLHLIPFLPAFYLHDLLLSFLLLINLPHLFHQPKTKLEKSLFLFLLLFALFNPNKLYVWRYSIYFLSFLLLSKLKLNHKFLRQVVFLASLIILFLGLSQYFLLPDLRFLFYLGWDDHLHRLTFPYFDPNFTGVILSLFFLYFQKTKYKPASFLFLLAAFLTYSRSALLSLLLTLLLSVKNKLAIPLIIALFSLGLLLLPKKFGEGNNLWRTYSIRARYQNDLTILQHSLHHPFFGTRIHRSSTPFPNRAGTANNSFLYILETGGLLSLFSFFLFLFSLYQSSSHKQLLLFLILASLFNNVLFYPFVLLLLFVLETTDTTSASD